MGKGPDADGARGYRHHRISQTESYDYNNSTFSDDEHCFEIADERNYTFLGQGVWVKKQAGGAKGSKELSEGVCKGGVGAQGVGDD